MRVVGEGEDKMSAWSSGLVGRHGDVSYRPSWLDIIPFVEKAIIPIPPEDLLKIVMNPLGLGGGGDGGGGGGSNKFLGYVALAIGATAAAPVVYRLATRPSKGKRGQEREKVIAGLGEASSKATTLLTAMAPVLAFPIAYIGIDELENRGIITGGLGDAAQTLMTMAASGEILGMAGSIIKGVL